MWEPPAVCSPISRPGDLAIATAAIRDGGTDLHYLPAEFPAVAHIDVITALRDAAEKLGNPYHLGIVQSKDSFYGQHDPQRMPVANRLLERWKAWKDGGCLCSEMEAATVFILSSIYRVRSGAVMLMGINQESDDPDITPHRDQTDLLKTAIEALKILIEKDRADSK